MTQIQLRIYIVDIQPLVWRRVVISSDMTLLELHDLIQIVFGWEDQHLFMFEIGPFRFVDPDQWEEDAYQYQSAPEAFLEEIIPKYVPIGGHFQYVYDMGDGWQHQILVEKIVPEGQHKVPLCLDGKRACPPENIGGVGGYDYLLNILLDPSHEEHQTYKNWIGGLFDPERFDLKQINRGLKTKLKNKQIIRKSFWRQGDPYFYPRSFESEWTKTISAQNAEIAQSLPIRRDVITLLEYLLDHTVQGTKATGNFPRKHVRAISEKLVDPPELDLVIGDRVFEMRSEDEVRELIFLHIFANTAGLIYGAEGLVWEVTSFGEAFLGSDPVSQVWYLTSYWLRDVNWYFLYLFDDYEDLVDILTFTSSVKQALLETPGQNKIYVSTFIKKLDGLMPGWITSAGYRQLKKLKVDFLWTVVIEPFIKFGIIEIPALFTLETRYDRIKYFYLTDYGRSLLLSVEL